MSVLLLKDFQIPETFPWRKLAEQFPPRPLFEGSESPEREFFDYEALPVWSHALTKFIYGRDLQKPMANAVNVRMQVVRSQGRPPHQSHRGSQELHLYAMLHVPQTRYRFHGHYRNSRVKNKERFYPPAMVDKRDFVLVDPESIWGFEDCSNRSLQMVAVQYVVLFESRFQAKKKFDEFRLNMT